MGGKPQPPPLLGQRFEKSFCAISFTAPASRRQNIRTKPASAAKNEATGMRESGPIYTVGSPVDRFWSCYESGGRPPSFLATRADVKRLAWLLSMQDVNSRGAEPM